MVHSFRKAVMLEVEVNILARSRSFQGGELIFNNVQLLYYYHLRVFHEKCTKHPYQNQGNTNL